MTSTFLSSVPIPTLRVLLPPILLAAAAAPAAAQTEPLPGGFGEVVEVRVVNIEVVVTDRDGVPVLGLSGEDFVLQVDGEEVPIDYFAEVRGGLAVEPSARSLEAGIESIPGLAAGSPVGSNYLVFIDEFFAIRRDLNRVLDGIDRDLELLRPNDRMAIVAWNGRELEMLSSWNGSVPELRRVLRAAKERPAYGLQRLAEQRQLDYDAVLETTSLLFDTGESIDPTIYRTQLSPQERFYVQRLAEQVERSVEASAATLRSFAGPPGRKVMLLLSGGWPFLPAGFLLRDFSRFILDEDYGSGPGLFRPLTDTANLVGYTIYPVDVPGLNQEVIDIERSGAPSLNLDRRNVLREQEQHFSLSFLARETGGEAFINAARTEAFDRALSDTRSYYWLGFTPERGFDDRRHEVEVRLKDPGFRLRSRSSFLDSSRQREVTMAVESALLFGDAAGEGLLRLELGEPQRAGMRRIELPVSILIPLAEVTFLPAAGGQQTDLELRIAVEDESGGRSDIPVVPVRLATERAPRPGEYGRYQVVLKLRKAKQRGLVAIHDPASGRILTAGFELNL